MSEEPGPELDWRKRVVRVELSNGPAGYGVRWVFANGDEATMFGMLALKYNRVVHALCRYERDRRFEQGADIIDDIREALQ